MKKPDLMSLRPITVSEENHAAEIQLVGKHAAILAADLVGHERLTRDQGTETIAPQEDHWVDLTDPTIFGNNGRILKSTEQSLLVAYADADEAVLCAVTVQRAMIDREARKPRQRQVAIRIGISLNEIVLEDKMRPASESIVVATHLQSMAEPEAVYISDAVFKNVQGRLGLGFVKHGPHRLDNVAEPVPIYSVLLDPAEAGTLLKAKRDLPKSVQYAIAAGAVVVFLVLETLAIFFL